MQATRRSRSQPPALTDRALVRYAFDEASQARGNRYFERGHVMDVEAVGEHVLQADVRGTSTYEACIRFFPDSGTLFMLCSCPVGDRYAEPCKHLWAVLRTIDARGLVPADCRLITAGTVEEKVALLQQRKRDLVESVFGDEQAFLGKLSRDDLVALLDR